MQLKSKAIVVSELQFSQVLPHTLTPIQTLTNNSTPCHNYQ